MMNFVSKMIITIASNRPQRRGGVSKEMRNFALNVMNFASNVMNFALNTMNFAGLWIS